MIEFQFFNTITIFIRNIRMSRQASKEWNLNALKELALEGNNQPSGGAGSSFVPAPLPVVADAPIVPAPLPVVALLGSPSDPFTNGLIKNFSFQDYIKWIEPTARVNIIEGHLGPETVIDKANPFGVGPEFKRPPLVCKDITGSSRLRGNLNEKMLLLKALCYPSYPDIIQSLENAYRFLDEEYKILTTRCTDDRLVDATLIKALVGDSGYKELGYAVYNVINARGTLETNSALRQLHSSARSGYLAYLYTRMSPRVSGLINGLKYINYDTDPETIKTAQLAFDKAEDPAKFGVKADAFRIVAALRMKREASGGGGGGGGGGSRSSTPPPPSSPRATVARSQGTGGARYLTRRRHHKKKSNKKRKGTVKQRRR